MPPERISARPSLQQAVRILAAHGATRVVVFGSAARSSDDGASDLDLACQGIPPARFFRAYGHLVRALGNALDLIDLDEAKPSLRARIERDGILVHES